MKKHTLLLIVLLLLMAGCTTAPTKGDFPQPEYFTEKSK